MRTVTLKQLRALVAIAETGTVTAAARKLNVTPPAVTSQMRLLEEAAGLPLLDRLGDRYEPTAAGVEIMTAVARIEAALGQCDEALESLKGLSGGQASLGVVSTAKYFAPFALGAFARDHPGIEVSLFVGNRRDIIAALTNETVDIAIMGRPPESLAVDKTVIGKHPHVVIAPTGHPMAQRTAIPASELADETFLVREMGSGTRNLMETFFEREGVTPELGMEIGSNETIKQAVMAGLGLSFISAHTVANEVADGRLAILDVESLPAIREWFVVKRSEKRLLPASDALMRFLIEEGAAYLPDLKV